VPDFDPTKFDSPELLKAIDDFDHGNYAVAVAVFARLAEMANPRAQCYLAFAYQFGWGVPADGKMAVDLLVSVAQRNIRDGCLSAVAYNNLATIYVTGLPGIEKDECMSEEYRRRSQELGFEMWK
jgi:TPR repeat protein